MIPKISVSPAASRNSNSPNCRPFRHCSRRRSIALYYVVPAKAGTHAPGWDYGPPHSRFPRSPFHRAAVVEAVLVVLDDGGDGLERQISLGVLHDVLEIEILDRELIVAVLVRPAHGPIVGLAHL